MMDQNARFRLDGFRRDYLFLCVQCYCRLQEESGSVRIRLIHRRIGYATVSFILTMMQMQSSRQDVYRQESQEDVPRINLKGAAMMPRYLDIPRTMQYQTQKTCVHGS